MTTRSRLELALGQTERTITAFLEQLVGESVDAHERRHVMTQARTPNFLGVGEGHPLLQRSAVLRGRRSAQPYMHAESLLVPSRLPAAFCRRLETSNDPIGRILAKEGMGFTRSALPRPDRCRASIFSDARVPDEHLLARTYRVDVDGVPVMVISEWFLATLESFLRPS
ncbi:MAG: chorismate pyruvate-lyase family protein [Acidimicrobiales bacterium]